MISWQVTGIEDIEKAVKRLDSRKARNIMARALNQAAQPVVKEARSNADSEVGKNTGKGRKAIRKRNLKKQERAELNLDQAVMVYLHPDGFYLGIWELGFVRDGKHYAARPWLRPALHSQEASVISQYRERAKILLEKEVAKQK